MLFCKCGCLVAHEKYIFRKCFSVLTCLWCKMISVFILPSNTIFRKTHRERECVSETAPACKEREREEEERAHCRRPTSFDFADDLETSRHKPRSPFDFDFESHQDCTLRLHWWTQRPRSHAFDFAPFNFTDFARLQLHRDGTDRIEFAIEKWLGFDEFDQIWWIFFG